MADRIEREIEEILSKLDELPGDGNAPADRRPVSIAAHREKRRATEPKRQRPRPSLGRLNPGVFLLGGAGTVIGGLILSSFWGPLIWAAFAGVLVFLGGFVAAFFRTARPAAGAPPPGGTFWRDRYINAQPTGGSLGSRITRRFRRR